MAHPAYRGRRFDVIFANILARPLITLAPNFEHHMARNGTLIISGLLNEQARAVLSPAIGPPGSTSTQQIVIGQWTSLALKR